MKPNQLAVDSDPHAPREEEGRAFVERLANALIVLAEILAKQEPASKIKPKDSP